jgi:hypothetical protein
MINWTTVIALSKSPTEGKTSFPGLIRLSKTAPRCLFLKGAWSPLMGCFLDRLWEIFYDGFSKKLQPETSFRPR